MRVYVGAIAERTDRDRSYEVSWSATKTVLFQLSFAKTRPNLIIATNQGIAAAAHEVRERHASDAKVVVGGLARRLTELSKSEEPRRNPLKDVATAIYGEQPYEERLRHDAEPSALILATPRFVDNATDQWSHLDGALGRLHEVYDGLHYSDYTARLASVALYDLGHQVSMPVLPEGHIRL